MIKQNQTYGAADMVRLPFRCAPVSAAGIAVQKVLAGLVPALQALATARFIDRAIAVAGKSAPLASVYPALFALIGLIAYNWVSNVFSKFALVRLQIGIRTRFRTEVTAKCARLEYRHIENSDTWDLISRIIKEPDKAISTAHRDLWDVVLLIEQIAGVVLLLITQVWWAALLIAAMAAPLFALAMKSGRANYDSERKTSRFKRRYEYLSEVLTGREAADERTLFGFSDEVGKTWYTQFEAARKFKVRTEVKWFLRMKGGGLAVSLISLAVMLVLLHPALTGTLSIGMFFSLTAAISTLVQQMSWDLTRATDSLAKHREYLKDLTRFAALTETPSACSLPADPPPKFTSLELKGVRFAYPGCEDFILDGLTLTLKPGLHYAFVGVNGAGKTTVTKLLTGLYDGYEGEILLNGKSLAAFDQSEVKATFSVIYQDFAKYSISFKDNILLGDAGGMGRMDDTRLMAAAEYAGLLPVLKKLPLGADTPLGRIKEGGADLSGGEWQRLAMARALVSPAPVLILDEPTAALDPIGESKLYEEFESISRGRTTLFISHRLGSTKLADEIFVIGDGCVLEHGSHDELMKQGREYALMFESQRSWYE